MTRTVLRDPNLAVGALVLSFLGAVWLWIWNGVSNGASGVMSAAILAGWCGLSALAAHVLRRRLRLPATWTDAERAATTKRFNRINLWQWGTIGLAVLLLSLLGARSYIPYAIIVIVGLHFFPLAQVLRCPEYRVAGSCLTALGLAACAATMTGHDASLATAATGLLLWATALAIVRTG